MAEQLANLSKDGLFQPDVEVWDGAGNIFRLGNIMICWKNIYIPATVAAWSAETLIFPTPFKYKPTVSIVFNDTVNNANGVSAVLMTHLESSIQVGIYAPTAGHWLLVSAIGVI